MRLDTTMNNYDNVWISGKYVVFIEYKQGRTK